MRAAGAIITTSESFLYECMGDAGIPEYVPNNAIDENWLTGLRFRAMVGLVKETGGTTKSTLEALLSKI
jgi:hypothetical protein